MQKFTDAVQGIQRSYPSYSLQADLSQGNDLLLETLDAPIQNRMFMDSVGGDANNGVNIFKISSKPER
jgi:hypothetical protein